MEGRCGLEGGREVVGRRWEEVRLAVVEEKEKEEEGVEQQQQGRRAGGSYDRGRVWGEVMANKIQTFGSISRFGFI